MALRQHLLSHTLTIHSHLIQTFYAASSGEYVPVLVDHSEELACRGQFFLHHGLQRRIRLTIVHERADLRWRDVRELVVGRIRTTPDSMIDDDEDGSILSLGLFPGEILEIPGDDRTMFRFEAAWDSSLHNSLLLNRVTPSGETVYMTISAYLEVSFIISISLSYPPIIKQSVHCSWRAAPSQPSSPRTSP